jgi:site-specific DNA-adenine methylase
VKEDILTVTKTMQNNMNKVLDRGSKLEDLQDKTGTVICTIDSNLLNYVQYYLKHEQEFFIRYKTPERSLSVLYLIKQCFLHGLQIGFKWLKKRPI